MIPRFFGWYGLLLSLFAPVMASEITANEVFVEAYRLGEEIKILQRHFDLPVETTSNPPEITVDDGFLLQQTREVLHKINLLREKFKRPRRIPAGWVPIREPRPWDVWEQLRRVGLELQLLKAYLDIADETPVIPAFSAKTTRDTYVLLREISSALDRMRGAPMSMDEVFAQAVRIMEDVDAVLKNLRVLDDTVPPAKRTRVNSRELQPALFDLMREVERLKRAASLPVVDYPALMPMERKTLSPEEALHLCGLVLAELQPLKAELRLTRVTPPANAYQDKTAADIQQLLEWATRKLRLARGLKTESPTDPASGKRVE